MLRCHSRISTIPGRPFAHKGFPFTPWGGLLGGIQPAPSLFLGRFKAHLHDEGHQPERDTVEAPSDSAYLDLILESRDAGNAPLKKQAAFQARHASRPASSRSSQRDGRSRSTALDSKNDIRARARRRTAYENWRRKNNLHLARAANSNIFCARVAGAGIRTKFVSLGLRRDSQDHFSQFWNINFARIQKAYDKAYGGDGQAVAEPPILSLQAIEWADHTLSHLQRSNEPLHVLTAYRGGSARVAVRRWCHVALWLLYNEPELIVDFLRATNVAPFPPTNCVEDSLQYLATHFSQSEKLIKEKHLPSLGKLFVDLANQRKRRTFRSLGSFFRLLIPFCTDEQIHQLYRTIKTRLVKVPAHTYLHFATYFAKHESFEQSLEAILRAHRAGIALSSVPLRNTCATLLRTAIRLPSGLRVTLRIVSNFVKIGLPLDTPLSTIVMLNAVEAGDLKTAFSVYHSLVEQGLKPNEYAYCALLKGCKSVIDDAETLNTTIRGAIHDTDVLGSIVLATEILHCLALHHTRNHPGRAFKTVLDAYAQLFNLAPLQKLGIPVPPEPSPLQPSRTKLQPNQYALGIMLAVYVDHSFGQTRTTEPIYMLYRRVRSLIEAGEEPFVRLAATDHVANTFLATFIRTGKGLLYAAEVIKDMQRPLPATPASAGDSVRQCEPTRQTWSIFLHGFARHGRTSLAEQVLTYMRAKGIEPDTVTWNTLIAGHAAKQDLEGALDAVRRAEADGFVWDDWTHRGLQRFNDQEQLLERYRQQKLVKELDFTGELRDSLTQRLAADENSVSSVDSGRSDTAPAEEIQTQDSDAAERSPDIGHARA